MWALVDRLIFRDVDDIKRLDSGVGILCMTDGFELLIEEALARHAKRTREARFGCGEDGIKDMVGVAIVVCKGEKGFHIED